VKPRGFRVCFLSNLNPLSAFLAIAFCFTVVFVVLMAQVVCLEKAGRIREMDIALTPSADYSRKPGLRRGMVYEGYENA